MHIRTSARRQVGFSLIELMVGMAVGLIIVGGAISVYVNAVRSGGDTLRSAKLNIELRGAMNMMIADIRRAGYAYNVANLSSNPFTQTSTNLALPSADCLLFSYDRNGDGAINANEYLGFKKAGTEVSMRFSGGSTAAGCSAAGDSWESITDNSSILVDSLTFTISNQCENAQTGLKAATEACAAGSNVYDVAAAATGKSDLIEIRDVTISITGHHRNDALTTMTLSQSVRVRNDRIQTVGI